MPGHIDQLKATIVSTKPLVWRGLRVAKTTSANSTG